MFCVHSKGDKLKGGETLYWSRQNEGTAQCLRHRASHGQGLKPNPELLTHSQAPSSKILKITKSPQASPCLKPGCIPAISGSAQTTVLTLADFGILLQPHGGPIKGLPHFTLSLSLTVSGEKIYKTKPCYPFQKCSEQ